MSPIKVELEQQVVDFIRSLPPEAPSPAAQPQEPGEGKRRYPTAGRRTRGFLSAARTAVSDDFFYHVRGESRTIRCGYAAPRSIVYEVFAQRVRESLP
jgi:hypothetical protein